MERPYAKAIFVVDIAVRLHRHFLRRPVAANYSVDGRSLIGLDEVAQIAHGYRSLDGDQINLSIQAAGNASAAVCGSIRVISGCDRDWVSKLAYASQRGGPICHFDNDVDKLCLVPSPGD